MIMNSSELIISVIQSIPKGKVMSYGQIAAVAGMPQGARLVVRILNSSSEKHSLPWWRVVRSNGEIGLPGEGGALKRAMLNQEGIAIERGGRIPAEFFFQGR